MKLTTIILLLMSLSAFANQPLPLTEGTIACSTSFGKEFRMKFYPSITLNERFGHEKQLITTTSKLSAEHGMSAIYHFNKKEGVQSAVVQSVHRVVPVEDLSLVKRAFIATEFEDVPNGYHIDAEGKRTPVFKTVRIKKPGYVFSNIDNGIIMENLVPQNLLSGVFTSAKHQNYRLSYEDIALSADLSTLYHGGNGRCVTSPYGGTGCTKDRETKFDCTFIRD